MGLEDRRRPVGCDLAVVFEDRHDLAPGAADPAIPQPGDRLPLGLDQDHRRPPLAEPLAHRAAPRLHHDDLHPVTLGLRVERPQGRLEHVPAVDRGHHDRQIGLGNSRPLGDSRRRKIQHRGILSRDDDDPSNRSNRRPGILPVHDAPDNRNSTTPASGQRHRFYPRRIEFSLCIIAARIGTHPEISPVWYRFCLTIGRPCRNLVRFGLGQRN